MSQLVHKSARAIAVMALAVIVASAAAAQTPVTKSAAATKADCDRMEAMEHGAMGQMDHGAMGQGAMGQMDHGAMMKGCDVKTSTDMTQPTMSGQAAFGTIGEVVRMLENDPATDWSKVNIEALRLHLIDMDNVTLHSRIAQHNVPGGIVATVTGTPATAAAIRRMIPSHVMMFESSPEFDAKVKTIPSGVELTVLARNPADSGLVARVRGLGAIGFLTEGDHHARHHLAIARGDAMAHMH